jgi:hypothetical protein
MKYLKTYEVSNTKEPNFKKGDYVYCIDPSYNHGEKLHPYKHVDTDIKYCVDFVYKNQGVWFCNLKGKGPNFYCTSFIPEAEYDAKKYNI